MKKKISKRKKQIYSTKITNIQYISNSNIKSYTLEVNMLIDNPKHGDGLCLM